MPKSRTIKIASGTVVLDGYNKDFANKLEAYINKFNRIDTTPKGERVFKDKALGLVLTGIKYELVVVGYDKSTGECRIEESKDAGDFKQHAISIYQQEMFKRGLV